MIRVGLCPSQREQQLCAALRIRFEHLGQAEGELVHIRCLLVGEQAHGLIRCAYGVVKRLGGVAPRRRLREVVCQLDEMPWHFPVDGLQGLADRSMQLNAPRPAEPRVKGLPDQVVREPKVANRAGRLGDQAGRYGLFDRTCEVVVVRHPLERREPELAPDHCSSLENLDRARTERLEAAPNRLSNRVGEWETAYAVCLEANFDPALGGHEPGDLAREEGIALRCGAQRAQELRRPLLAGALLYQAPDLPVVEPLEGYS